MPKDFHLQKTFTLTGKTEYNATPIPKYSNKAATQKLTNTNKKCKTNKASQCMCGYEHNRATEIETIFKCDKIIWVHI